MADPMLPKDQLAARLEQAIQRADDLLGSLDRAQHLHAKHAVQAALGDPMASQRLCVLDRTRHKRDVFGRERTRCGNVLAQLVFKAGHGLDAVNALDAG